MVDVGCARSEQELYKRTETRRGLGCWNLSLGDPLIDEFEPVRPPVVPYRRNPFGPHPGMRPAVLAGRSREIAAARGRLDRVAAGSFAPALFFLAPRGLGKTVLLDEVGGCADERGFVVAAATAGTGQELVEVIVSSIRRTLQQGPVDLRDRVAAVFARLQVTLTAPGLEVGLSGAEARRDDGPLSFTEALHELSIAVRNAGHSGVVILVDEIQQASPESLRHLLPALQELGSRAFDSPIAFFGAGAVSTPRTLAAVFGFAERFEYRHLERLDPISAALAFGAAGEAEPVWLPGAVERAIDAADGHPYLVQLIGHHAWEESGATQSLKAGILPADVEIASDLASRDLQRIFAARWEDRSDAERAVLGLLAQSPEGASRASLAAALDSPRESVESAIRNLYDDGWLDMRGLDDVVFAYQGIGSVVSGRIGQPSQLMGVGEPEQV